jgi:hypothetical protein
LYIPIWGKLVRKNKEHPHDFIIYIRELISKLLKSVTPAKIGAQKRAENTGDQLSPERQQQTFEIGSRDRIFLRIKYHDERSWRKCMGIEPTRDGFSASHRI